MEKRKLQLAIMAVVIEGTLAAPSLFAYVGLDGTLTFSASTYQYGDGGEFNMVTSGLGSFPTFCLETSEYIGQPPSGPYTYTINMGAVPGDAGADATDPHTGLPMDNISIGTAWLYSQFRAGTLSLDTGTGTYFDGNRLANAGELQQAIWYLEDEAGGANNGYVTLAESALGGLTLDQVKADSNGAYGVVALNLFDPSSNLAQDQLAMVLDPTTVAPEPGATALAGLGCLCLAGWTVRRRLALLEISWLTKIRSKPQACRDTKERMI